MNEVLVTRCIEYSELAIWSGEVPCCHFDCDTTLLLLLCLIHYVSECKAILVILLSLSFISSQLLTGHMTMLEQDLA